MIKKTLACVAHVLCVEKNLDDITYVLINYMYIRKLLYDSKFEITHMMMLDNPDPIQRFLGVLFWIGKGHHFARQPWY